MPTRVRLAPQLRVLAGAQGGVLSRRQLLGHGLHPSVITRMLVDGVLHPLTPGIYTFGPAAGWLSRAWAGVLLGGEHAVLGHESAAHLLGLQKQEPTEVAVFVRVQRAFRPGYLFIKAQRRATGEPPCTTVETTVLDLCASADEDQMAAVLANAVSGRYTTTKRLLTELAARPAQRHRATLREILGDVEQGAHSALERRYLVNVERAHQLPQAQRQRHVHGKHRSDAWYEQYRLVIELDSKLHHSGGALFHDMDRDNDHALLGQSTVRFGWAQVTGTGACHTARTVAGLLAARGWPGMLAACRHCRLMPPEG